jgi:TM2 domain-containing membrane protein YozV
MKGPGSNGNVVAAVCSFFVPGLGQLVQGRLVAALLHFVLASALWFVFLGWAVHLWSVISAARYVPEVGSSRHPASASV